jgi:hypothetical protein
MIYPHHSSSFTPLPKEAKMGNRNKKACAACPVKYDSREDKGGGLQKSNEMQEEMSIPNEMQDRLTWLL